jgi:Protein of unknown function (DUF499)
MPGIQNWADILRLRPEVNATEGRIGDLQMSLYSAVYSNRQVQYREPEYYSDITEPTAGLIGFMATIARRLGGQNSGERALFHLDQGMGGGKSHALVGLYHLANSPDRFLRTELGQRVRTVAEGHGPIDIAHTKVVVLSGDNMTPGATSPEFGPARTLHARFLWALLDGDAERYEHHLAEGPNKAALQRALESVSRPVLILLDEVMDYVLQLSDAAQLGTMPGEQSFVGSLMDAVDEVSRVAFVVVMIKSEFDERGYTVEAEGFRDYIASRIERNGDTIAVTEAADFAAILYRRLFIPPTTPLPVGGLVAQWRASAAGPWEAQVFDRLGAGRTLASLRERVEAAYPFHPDLMAMVREDWSRHAGFQRVRSTVSIFALAVFHWIEEHQAGRWVPDLIGVGDLPLRVVLESVLSSGLLHGNERAIQGFRQVASTDVVTRDGSGGRAREMDAQISGMKLSPGQPTPAERMATALYCYSLVPRDQARRGATKAELLAAIYAPGTEFQAAEEVFNLLTADDAGLGALETATAAEGGGIARYRLSISQTPQMFYRQAKATINPDDRDAFLWERAKTLVVQGPFDAVLPVDQGDHPAVPLARLFAEVDQNSKTRLVVLDPRRWALLNGRDTPTRSDIESLLGVGADPLPVDNAASCVISCVNTQRREDARKRATEYLAWRAVVSQLEGDPERLDEAQGHVHDSTKRLDTEIRRAFQHYAYLVWGAERIEVEWERFDDDHASALQGNQVWAELAEAGRATKPAGVSGVYLASLLERLKRSLTLKEIVQQFYKNPVFPLVRSSDEVRRAIYEMTQTGWIIAGPDSTPLDIRHPADLSIGSMDQTLQRAVTEYKPQNAGAGHLLVSDGHPAEIASIDATGDDERQYKRGILRLANQSVVNSTARQRVTDLLWALYDTLEPAKKNDVQLLDATVTVTADAKALEGIRTAAATSGAQWREEDADF